MSEYNPNERAAAFVLNWRDRASTQQRKYTILSAVAFILVFFICFFLFLMFQNSNYVRIVRQNMNYIEDSAISATNHIEQELYNGKTFDQNLAKQYANLYQMDIDMSVEERLTLLSDKTIFDRIAYISPDGMDTSLEGVADVSDRHYFKEAIKGNSGWEMIDKSRVTGNPILIFYAPIYCNNEIIGVMAGFYEKDKLEGLFSYELFNYHPNTYLLLGDGSVIANSKHEAMDRNLLEALSEKKYVSETDYQDIVDAIADDTRTTISFSFIDGRETSVGVIVQLEDSDWMMLSILPDDITSSMLTKANKSGTLMGTSIVFVFILLSILLLFFFSQQKNRLKSELSNAAESLSDAVRDEEKQLAIITSLGNTYSSIYFLDLISLTYHRIKEDTNKEIAEAIPADGGIDEGFAYYIKNYIADIYQDALTGFIFAESIAHRLESSDEDKTIEYQRKDGKWRRATLVETERGKDGNIISAVFAVQQIDKEKEKDLQTKKALEDAYEAARLASNAKTRFLSNMSHDIRTPMNAIVGMTAIAGSNLDNTEKVADCLKKITYSSKHLLGLINEVLDMSKIESGKVDLIEEEFNMSDLMSSLVTINQPLINEKHQHLIVKINKIQHEDVVGDRTRLMQVFTNFLSNAIKYTPDNGMIEISLSEKDSNSAAIGWFEAVFKDNGMGMSEEFTKRIFEPFSRATDDRIAGIQGTGLGMPIAKNIINMMNGDITVESEIDKGTTFTVSFALKLQSKEDINYEEFINLPILVADDDADACESTCMILDELSMKSEWVTSGREALAKVISRHETDDDYYAVILDWKMPDMNGVDTAREIRKHVGEDIPIVVISAYDWSDIEQEARDAGVNSFLSKPLFKSKIVNLFSELVGISKNGDVSVKDEFSEYDYSGKRALLVEDNDINREMAVEFFAMIGLETETADNGRNGVDMFLSSPPGYFDIIFMDIQMPIMDGYEATMAIRALNREDAETIPIIAMTANAFVSDVRRAINCGMNGHIAKPIDMRNVVKALRENLKS